MAEAIAASLAPGAGLPEAEFRSAGTSATPGLPASAGALGAAGRHGLELKDHRSSPLSRPLIEWADLILTMGPSHRLRVLELGGGGKTTLLGEFAEGGGEGGLAVPDPYGGADEVYEATFLTLEEYVGAALNRIAGGGS